MSWQADSPPGMPPRAMLGTTLELPASTPEMVDALRQDRFALMRDAVVWQRPLRLLGLGILLALVVVLGEAHDPRSLASLALLSAAYTALVVLVSRAVQRGGAAHDARIPVMLVTADLVAISGLVWLSTPPVHVSILLVPALLVVQSAAYYYGRDLGSYCVGLSAGAYLLTALVLRSPVTGPPESPARALLTVLLFILVGGVLVRGYAAFRTRMNELRLFCRLVEDGDLAPAIAVGVESRPDDLTLLARSFDAMRMRLAEQIGTDPLTSCLNRRALETRLRAEWRQAARRGTTVAVLAIDIDHFKRINDTRGHPVGDVVLQELAGIFRATARDTDAVARLGGDEFVIVLPDTGWQGALRFAERVRRKVEDFAFGAPTNEMDVTISVGVALARGTDPMAPDVLLLEADRSLYKAKTGGRNRIFA